jgi:hypothetical protein
MKIMKVNIKINLINKFSEKFTKVYKYIIFRLIEAFICQSWVSPMLPHLF